MEAPDLSPPRLPATVPTVANLLEGVNMPGISLDDATAATAELLTAASVDDPVGVVEQPAPRYPPALEQAGITGHVELEYVVDTTGRAEPGSLRTLVTTHPAFEAAAHVTILASRYRPARLRGRVCVSSFARRSGSAWSGGLVRAIPPGSLPAFTASDGRCSKY